MRIASLDIETMATPAGLARLIDRESAEISAPSNYKDKDKIAAYIAEKQATLATRCEKEGALSPLYGQVVSVAVCDLDGPEAMTLGSEEIGGQEAALLRQVAGYLKNVDLLVTFNGHRFDGWFLQLRMLIHWIAPPACLDARRYQLTPHLDLYAVLTNWAERGKGGLADWCAAFSVPCPGKDLGITGADVARLVREQQWDLLADYNLGDAIATWGLLCRLWPALRHKIPGAQGLILETPAASGLANLTGASNVA